MGAYLSEPKTEKSSSDEANEFVVCGLSSMQGWRVTQEDAHNAVLNFDDGASLFAVYDGHGGHEVAAYCAQNLPKFIRETEAYKKGDYIEALKQAFLEFDQTITKQEIMALLKQMAGKKDDDGSASEDEDDDNVINLYEEAKMPIEQVIAKYQSDAANPAIRKLQSVDGKTPPSPFLKCRRAGSSSFAGSSGASSSTAGSSGAGCSSSSDGAGGSGSSASCSSSAAGSSSHDLVSSSSCQEAAGSSSSAPTSSKDDLPDTQAASPDVGSSGDVKQDEKSSDATVSSGSGDATIKQNGDVDSTVRKELNGDISHDVSEGLETTSKNDTVSSSSPTKEVPVKNGTLEGDEANKEVRIKGKGKAKDKSPRPDSAEVEVDGNKEAEPKKKYNNSRLNRVQLYRNVLALGKSQGHSNAHSQAQAAAQAALDESDETDDEDDTTFDGGLADSDDDDDDDEEMLGEHMDDDDDDEDEEDEEEEDSMYEDDEEEEEEEEECDDFNVRMTEEPGLDSGCTAVVALLKGRDLFVANAGDSRCVVCRGGKAVDMSLDHKPEDTPEMERILKAGGRVTCDGRVNGGLNLSRAIGDHAYKQSKELPATEQMITSLPDVRTLRIDPEQDEFMVLACDGIWNFLSSQEVVDFVRTRIKENKLKVSQICEELFDHCLAPNTLGDGTGCDNMTAVIVRFQPELSKAPSTLTHDSVFDTPISNDSSKEKEEKPPKAESAICNDSSKEKEEKTPVAESEAEASSDGSGKAGQEVSTSNSLKRSPDDMETDVSSVDSPQPQDKRAKTESSESASLDSEAVAVEV